MKCHVRSCALPEMSCFVMRAVSAGLSARSSSRAAARASAAAVGFGHVCLLPGKRAGRGVPVSRAIARACARGRGRAYRGGAVRARDCPRETAHAPRPSVPAGVFFAAPSQSLSAETPKGGPPGEPPLSTFILSHFASGQALSGTKNENTGDFSWNAGGTGQQRPGHRGGGEGHATQSHRNRMCGAGSPPGRVRHQSRRVIRPSTAGETVPAASTNSIAWAAIREASLVSRRRSASSNMA